MRWEDAPKVVRGRQALAKSEGSEQWPLLHPHGAGAPTPARRTVDALEFPGRTGRRQLAAKSACARCQGEGIQSREEVTPLGCSRWMPHARCSLVVPQPPETLDSCLTRGRRKQPCFPSTQETMVQGVQFIVVNRLPCML